MTEEDGLPLSLEVDVEPEPAPVLGRDQRGAASFVAVTVFARGLLNRLFTRAYLPGDPDVLAATPLLAGLEPDRSATLVATEDGRGFRFDIHLQGDRETVFLRHPRH